ncbi:putative phage tail protein [Clostridioides difficile]|uniref:putative phage tail protein n=1 Tax=Clostridioides difficile TaxID=1496 RepID=UPI0003B29859|nr:putative phage tail protein [Clostridioides difficile]CCL56658.1 Putative phage XkdT-like protein [Clostridioides difficile T17]
MKLIDKLPSFDRNYIVEEIQGAYDTELNILKEDIDDTFNQLFVDTATWGLDMWEDILCIEKKELDFDTRRSNIKAKMRSRGTSTIEVIKSICEAYTKSETDIKVYSDEFTFVLSFIANNCDYKTLLDCSDMIERVKPAHLLHYLEPIILDKSMVYCGGGMVCSEEVKVHPYFEPIIKCSAVVNCGAGMISREEIKVYPLSIKCIENNCKINIAIANDTGVENVVVYPKSEVG